MDAQNPDIDVEELWSIEAERWQEIESGIAKTIPWEEVRAVEAGRGSGRGDRGGGGLRDLRVSA